MRDTDARPGQGSSSIAQYGGTSISPYFSATRPSNSNSQSTAKQPDNGLGATEINVIPPPKGREAQIPLFIASSPPLARPEDENFWANDDGSPIGRGDAKHGIWLPENKQLELEKDNGISPRMEDLDLFEDDSMDFDPKFLEGLDTVEKEAYDRIVPPPSSALTFNPESSDKSRSSTAASPSTGRSIGQVIDVITIDEDDDGDAEDKENVPVPTRHVRRRTEDDVRGGRQGTRTLSGSQRARNPGRPTILAKTASAVIDLSDSD
jgi:RecQ-mediated genome instability protein 1